MRNFWALPAVLRLAIAVQPSFNVYTDLLAFPQYDIVYSETFIHEADAHSILSDQRRRQADPASEALQQDVQSQHQMRGDARVASTKDVYEKMIFEDIPYLCTIPHVAPYTTDGFTTASAEEQEQELMRASDHGWELLQGMQGNCLYYAGGWWVYSFCYNEGIKQFHPLAPGRGGVPLFPPQEDRSVDSYVLGKFEDQTGKDAGGDPSIGISNGEEATTKDLSAPPRLQTRGEVKYLVQNFDGGTRCDLTGRPRRIEVQFHCNPSSSDRINLIKETSSCVYLMVIHTPRLCNDVAFQPPQVDKPNPIACREIVAAEDVESWKDWKKASAEVMMQEQELQAQPPSVDAIKAPLVIGGIEVGAQKLVGGSPERSIVPSNIVTGDKQGDNDKYLATLASSDGKNVKLMSDKEIEKLGLKGAKNKVDEYRKHTKQLAGIGKPWELELWRTAEGLEFRMIIGSDEAEESGDGKKDDAERKQSKDKIGREDEPHEGSEEEYK